MTLKRVRPREGLLIRDPYTKLVIPPEGADVLFVDGYRTTIMKHINAGDLIAVDAPKTLIETGVDQRKSDAVSTAVQQSAKKGEG